LNPFRQYTLDLPRTFAYMDSNPALGRFKLR
jgi:hypothetical protein